MGSCAVAHDLNPIDAPSLFFHPRLSNGDVPSRGVASPIALSRVSTHSLTLLGGIKR